MGWASLADVLDEAAVRRVRELLGDRSDAVVTIGDIEGRLLWSSEAGSQDLFGRSAALVEGRTRFDFVHPDDQGRARRNYARALEGETVRYVVRGRTADDTWRRCASVAWSVPGPWGRVVLTITIPLQSPPTSPEADQP